MPGKSASGGAALVAAYLDGRPPPDAAQVYASFAVLSQFVGGILFEIDEDGRYLSVLTGDPSLLAMPVESLKSGLTVHEVLGEELGEPFVSTFNRVLSTGNPERVDYTLDVPAGRRNFRCEVRPSPRGTRSLVLLVQDVTDETQLKAKLVEAERLAAMGLVAASVGHEIRQPLAFATTSIEVLARQLERAGINEGPAQEALEHVRDAIERIRSIATSINIVVPDRHHETTTDVRRPIEAAIDLCASELQGRARVSLDIDGGLPKVRANEGELCQVITNLLLNAAHAVDPAKSQNRIDVCAKAHGDAQVRISVRDDGCGIDPAYVGRVFDPFFTTKGPGRGTGLGLFVTRRIVEAVGGALEIQSQVNSGTTVHVTLPVASPLAASNPIEVSAPRRLRILVIDDELAFLRSLELVLEEMHDVVVSQRSVDALALLRAAPERFDAVLCDLSMPEIDGVAFHAYMEELGLANRFILMTAGAFTQRGEEFLRQSKCRRIGKPFTLDRLLTILGSVTTH